MHDGEDLNLLPQPVNGYVGGATNDQFPGAFSAPLSANLRKEAQSSPSLGDPADSSFGSGGIVEGDKSANIVKVLKGFLSPDDIIH